MRQRRFWSIAITTGLLAGGLASALAPAASAARGTALGAVDPNPAAAAGLPAYDTANPYEGLDGLADLFAEQGADTPGTPAAQAESAVKNGAEAGLAAERSGDLAEEFGAKIGEEGLNFFFDFGLNSP